MLKSHHIMYKMHRRSQSLAHSVFIEDPVKNLGESLCSAEPGLKNTDVENEPLRFQPHTIGFSEL